MTYGRSGPEIHLHASQGKTVENKLSLYRDEMRKLAQIVDKDPEVRIVSATSALVAEHPGLFVRAGFTLEDVLKEIRTAYFDDQTRAIKRAVIDRKTLLDKWLQ
ncbi:hypothetical protein COV06_00280 [Candidatus Uhrbacteria bacterium CG10_big_fil_rev_8_21_14_0_10_50_16]|uniref:Uncharacterized protein n=1 Tax=Candidatus Uhrbacteria bacterium CG10_big_fil_rev_8_21_14_0_10_50_16 TaxID=1975039 RepID=A0A2H0RMU8_9BACT|nr:MAG: hypothetical protein COV06_00280 [Candidatus Uhrbacteria bacterium CG10_big_fil_rev_8_21_14_0_10_50_16]